MFPMIERLEDEKAGLLEFVERTANAAHTANDGQGRDLTDSEKETLRNAKERVAKIEEQLEPLREFAGLQEAHRSASSHYRPTEPADETRGTGLGARTESRGYEYRTVGEFLADVAMGTARRDAIDPVRQERAVARLTASGYEVAQGEVLSRATQTTADTPGILPENVVGQLINDVDAARPFLSSIGVKPLGGIPGKTFHRPVVTQSTQVGEQTGGEKTELPSRKMVIGDVDFTKRTFGGWVNISRQDIDWTSPSAWDAVVMDLAEQYALETEEAAATDFATAVTADTTLETSTSLGAADAKELATALFAAAVTTYGVAKRVPDTIWASLDVWALIGPTLVDIAASGGSGLGEGGSNLTFAGGKLLGVREVVVPSFPSGTLIIGNSNRTEAYEERIGLLSVVEPKILGVEVAYGGYFANGTLKAGAFSNIVPHA